MTRMQALPHDTAHGSPLDVLPNAPTRHQMEQFGLALMRFEPEHGIVDLSVMHHHAHHVYGRSVVIKAGTYLVGLAHKRSGLAVCVGDITVWTESGRQRYTGVNLLTSEPDVMRVGFAHADTTWLTVHANDTDSLDPRVIEDALVHHSELLLNRRQELTQ